MISLRQCETRSQCVSIASPRAPLKLLLLHSIVFHIASKLSICTPEKKDLFETNKMSLTLSGAHFSLKLILTINGNLGVFGVADHDSGIRIAKLKMANPRWRLCDSKVEFFEQFAICTLYGEFWSRILQI